MVAVGIGHSIDKKYMLNYLCELLKNELIV